MEDDRSTSIRHYNLRLSTVTDHVVLLTGTVDRTVWICIAIAHRFRVRMIMSSVLRRMDSPRVVLVTGTLVLKPR